MGEYSITYDEWGRMAAMLFWWRFGLLGTWFGYVPVETDPGYVRAMRLFGLRLWRGSAPCLLTGEHLSGGVSVRFVDGSGGPALCVCVCGRVSVGSRSSDT